MIVPLLMKDTTHQAADLPLSSHAAPQANKRLQEGKLGQQKNERAASKGVDQQELPMDIPPKQETHDLDVGKNSAPMDYLSCSTKEEYPQCVGKWRTRPTIHTLPRICQQQQYTPKINLRKDAKAERMKHVAANGKCSQMMRSSPSSSDD
jgi:hypothetical protein